MFLFLRNKIVHTGEKSENDVFLSFFPFPQFFEWKQKQEQ